MDPKLLADAVTTFLAPAMPYLVTGGKEVVEKAGKKLSEEGLEVARKLWGKLRPKVEAAPMARGAADEIAKAPDDPEAQETLSIQIRKILKADAALAAELTRLIEAAGQRTTNQAALYGTGAIAQGPGAVAAGQNGIAIGGSVQGDFHAGVDRRKPRGSADDE
jgi:hypothetical protein